MEGAHLIRSTGIISCPAGGTEGWQICLRSDNIYGPYEHKLIMNDSVLIPQRFASEGMVQLKNGDWWFIIMQDRGPIGRVPHWYRNG